MRFFRARLRAASVGLIAMTVAVGCTAGGAQAPSGNGRIGSRVTGATTGARATHPGSTTDPRTTGPASTGPANTGHPVDPASTARDRRLLVVWIRGELSPTAVAAVNAVPGVAAVAPVGEGTLWLTGPRAALGADAKPDAEIPIDAAAADPAALQGVLGAQPWLKALAHGDAVLSTTSAVLRRSGPGDLLTFAGGAPVTVGAVATDRAVGAHEVFLPASEGTGFGIGGADYLLVRIDGDAHPTTTERAVQQAVPTSPGHAVRVRSQAETAYLRQADGVMPPEWTKVIFGEFSATPGAGSVTIDPAWVRANIVTARVPILGNVTCNRSFVPLVRQALATIQNEGLANLVDPAHYGGCFAERLIRGSTSQISQHAYGAAIDINVSTNLLGARPTQDPRVIAAFQQHGFVWGGDFLLPDGMHFEYGCPAIEKVPERTKVPEELAGLALCGGG